MKEGRFYSFNFSKRYALKCEYGYLAKDGSSLVDLSFENVMLFDSYVDVKRFLFRLRKRGVSGFRVAFLVSVWSCITSRHYLMSSFDNCIEDMVDYWEEFLMEKGGKNA